jgi:hypothetical protein
MMNRKDEYKEFCEREKSIPLFLSYDWMNVVAPQNWNVLIEKRGNDIAGVLPYILNKRKGLKFLELTPLTPYGGPWIIYPEGQKYTNKLSYQKEIITGLIKQLPSFDSFVIKCHPSLTNWLPFYWEGFSQETWYTYILNDLSNTEKVFEGFKDDVRRNIRKSEKRFEIITSHSADVLHELKERSNPNTGVEVSKAYLDNILRFCKENNKGEILIARDGDSIHSAALFVWDQNTCYNLYAASDPDFKNSDAMTILIWHAIQKYSLHIKEFNFEGSMIKGVESFFRSFGAIQTPYFVIRKTNHSLLKIKDFLSDIF